MKDYIFKLLLGSMALALVNPLPAMLPHDFKTFRSAQKKTFPLLTASGDISRQRAHLKDALATIDFNNALRQEEKTEAVATPNALIKIPRKIYHKLTLQGAGTAITIEREHAKVSTTLKQLLEDIGDNPATIPLQNLDDSLHLIKPFFKLASEEKNNAIQEKLKSHSLRDLITIITSTNYLDMPTVKDTAVKIAAQKLIESEQELAACLDTPHVACHAHLPPDMQRQLAKEMLNIIPASHKDHLLNLTVKDAALKAFAHHLTHNQNNLYSCLKDSKGNYNFNFSAPVNGQLAPEMLKHLPGLKSKLLLQQAVTAHNGSIPGKTLTSLPAHAYAFSFSPDGKHIAVALGNRTVKIIDTVTGTTLNTLNGHTSSVFDVCYSPDGSHLASASEQTIKIWDTHTGQCIHTLTKNHSAAPALINAIAYSPDGKLLAAGDLLDTIDIWDTQTGQLLHSLNGHAAAVRSLCFSPDGKELVSGASDSSIKIWDPLKGTCKRTLAHPGSIYSVIYNPNGTELASSSSNYSIKIWNGPTGECKRSFTSINGHENNICYSPDGAFLALNDIGLIKICDAKTGTLIHSFPRNNSHRKPCYSPDGTTITCSASENEINNSINTWTVADKALSHWFDNDSKPSQVALLHYIQSCIAKGANLDHKKYPGIAYIDLPDQLKQLVAQHSWWQRTKTKWHNLPASLKYGLGTAAAFTAASAIGYGAWYLHHKYLSYAPAQAKLAALTATLKNARHNK